MDARDTTCPAGAITKEGKMGLTINTNIASLNAQRNLDKTKSPLETAMQRLSSGLKINSAKDDAAGLAIATRMQRQSRGLSVAIRNANDGVSFAQTAEGAMDEMINALQRISELSQQSASYNTSLDRTSMNTEVSELINELSRIVSQTRYNGDKFLNQSKSIDIQVGVEVKETINISTNNVGPTTMGVSTSFTNSLDASAVATSGYIAYTQATSSTALTLEGATIGNAFTSGSDYRNNSQNVINRINEYTNDTGVTAFGFGNSLTLSTAQMVASAALEVASGYLTINGTQIGTFTTASSGGTTQSNLITAINNKTTTTGVTAVAVDVSGAVDTSIDSATRIVLSNTSGAAISAAYNTSVTNASTMTTQAMASASMSVSAGQNGKIIFNDSLTDTSMAMSTVSGAVFGLGSSTSSLSLTASTVNDVSVTSSGNANVAILVAKEALETLNTEKATLGAKLNRFESTIRNLENVRENVTAARSRIMDADFAVETANLTKFMIIQQAGISVLAQANSMSQNVLALLSGR